MANPSKKHVDNLHDSVVFNDALVWCLEVIEQTMNFSVNANIHLRGIICK